MIRASLRTLALLGSCLSASALAQNRCVVPEVLPKARAEFPPPGSAVVAPITGYRLVMSWSPQLCKVNGDDKDHAARCKDQKFGFTLESLRADGTGRTNPEYCRRMGAVPDAVARENYCSIPSVKAMSHAWAKYGSCFADDAGAYFAAGRAAFATLHWPDMNRLSRSTLDVGTFKTAVAVANPGIRADMVSVGLTPLGWLEEVSLCLDLGYRPRSCPAGGGAGANSTMRIWPNY